ncbi:DivIVA domain-containing protein [Microbacterium oryzae]|uniref:DivIVA domain-containing protein n=1 Tax=Microbacterium oryzae TaxID=743009 RepID=UPI0025AEEFAD|nr:DivIVA domain-containing protein [Microbacterium oryzae]MDN3311890.1 DivIVA domain-containing protein [Microbacterium oryzae]
MALTPDDVVTKQFQHVRFKEGFDPDEVDDFLDEIVVEWRKTIEENEQLKAQLAQYESGDAAPAAEAPVEEAPEAPAAEAAPEQAQVEQAPVQEAPAASGVSSTASSAASIIERAQRLHDEHVAEGQAQAEQLVSEAQAKANQIVSDAEAKQREITTKLDTERKTLESRITELRQFERDYRQQLRTYFETKLKDLDSSATTASSTPVSAIGL